MRTLVPLALATLALTATLALFAASAPADARPATLDYTASWAHLGDEACDHFTYDCGGYHDLAVKGNIAYAIASGPPGLQVVDCNDPTNPRNRGFLPLGEDEPAWARRCDVRDHYAYVTRTDAAQIMVVDVDDHDAPVMQGTVPLGGPAADVLVDGPWLYALLGSDGATTTLEVHSLAQPWAPAFATQITLPAARDQRLAVAGSLVIAAGQDGLAAIDVTLPEWPALAGTLDLALGSPVWGLDARDALAVVADGSATHLVDLADPDAMQPITTLDEMGMGLLLTSTGQLWLGEEGCWRQGGLRMFDVADPAAPVLVGEDIDGLRGFPHAMAEVSGHVFAAELMCWCAGEWPALHVYRLGELPPPAPLWVAERGRVFDLLAHGDRLHVATDAGLETWDLADPAAPAVLQTVAPDTFCWRLAGADGLVATTRTASPGGSFTLQLLSRDPDGRLQPRGQLPLGGETPADLDTDGARVIVGYGPGTAGGILLVDAGDPDAPQAVATMRPGLQVRDVALDGDIMVLGFSPYALRVLSIADPDDPVLVAQLDLGGRSCEEIELQWQDGRRLLVVGRQDLDLVDPLVDIYDLTDPAAPVLLDRTTALCGGGELEPALTAAALVAANRENLTIRRWDAALARSEFLGRVPLTTEPDTYGGATRVAITSTAMVTARDAGQVEIWPLPAGTVTGVADAGARDDPGDPGADPPSLATPRIIAHPNPFNPACELRFSLSATGPATLDVLDLRGRRVRRLVRGTFAAGSHVVTWDGRDQSGAAVPAGVYLAHLRTGGEPVTIKLTLVE